MDNKMKYGSELEMYREIRKYTHNELVKMAEKWLINSKGCGFALTEIYTSTPERPDAIGFRDGFSILVEVKVSRTDFLADAKKKWRFMPEQGMGTYRFYLCPKGLIDPKELPPKWGLVYVDEKGKHRQVVGPKGNYWTQTGEDFRFEEKNVKAEIILLSSVIRRVYLRGDLQKIYEPETIKNNEVDEAD